MLILQTIIFFLSLCITLAIITDLKIDLFKEKDNAYAIFILRLTFAFFWSLLFFLLKY